jgi:signal transduction histidine kinase
MLSESMTEALRNGNVAGVRTILNHALESPTVSAIRITDLSGQTLAYGSARDSASAPPPLSAKELNQAPGAGKARIFDSGKGLVGVAEIAAGGSPAALAWVYPDTSEDELDLSNLLRSALLFALLAILANAVFSMLLARSVTGPLRGLLRGTKLLIRDPEHSAAFPIRTTSINEAGELTRSFNAMVEELREHRSGLHDTLALLDSMLANAPIGFAFFDRKARYVRVNRFLAEMDDLAVHEHLGRTVEETFSGPETVEFRAAIEQVFSTAEPVRDLELRLRLPALSENPRVWVVSLYPVRITPSSSALDRSIVQGHGAAQEQVQWVGAVIVDATIRKESEERLRRTEKLAATGRLAASIAHEINNPLEAVTNLLYLLHQQPLDPQSASYAEMAQQEIARVSQIAQQTLRFYRQSSRPTVVNPSEMLDSIVDLHQGRIFTANVEVTRRYREGADLLAFGGEIRQVFANLVGNALDAMPQGGRLILSIRPSCAWKATGDRQISGVRISVADTGVGMSRAVRRRIFDAFFTTKEATGTGLGLWVSSELIAKHRGSIRVRSRVRHGAEPVEANERTPEAPSGTVFMLFLPFEGVAEEWAESGNQNFDTQLGAERLSEVET